MTEVRNCTLKTNKNLTEESRFTVADGGGKDFGMEKKKKERESERDEVRDKITIRYV